MPIGFRSKPIHVEIHVARSGGAGLDDAFPHTHQAVACIARPMSARQRKKWSSRHGTDLDRCGVGIGLGARAAVGDALRALADEHLTKR